MSSLGESSYGVSPAIICPPLCSIFRLVVSDSQLELSSVSNSLSPVECSPFWHFALDLELYSVIVNLRRILETFLINVPFLVQSRSAGIPDSVSLVIVSASVDIQA